MVPCFCVCSSSALLEISRSVQCDFLSVLSYLRFFLSVSCSVLSIIILMCYSSLAFHVFVVLVGLVVSTCQVID